MMILFSIFSLISFSESKDRGSLVLLTWSVIIAVSMLAIIIPAWRFAQPVEEATYTVINNDGIDTINHNGELINLNSTFGRDFDDTVKLKIYKASYCGLAFLSEKIELAEK